MENESIPIMDTICMLNIDLPLITTKLYNNRLNKEMHKINGSTNMMNSITDLAGDEIARIDIMINLL